MPSDSPTPRAAATERPQVTRWLLTTTFGGMLLLMVLAGIDSMRSLRELNRVSREVTQQFSARSRALVTVVVSFHTYTDQMEQYLLSDHIVQGAPGADEIARYGAAVHAAIGQYPRNGGLEERALLMQIENGISNEEASFSGVLSQGETGRQRRGHALLYEQIIPGHTQVLQLASALSAFNDREFTEENLALAAQFQGLQTRLKRTVFLALAAGLLLSLVAAYYILRLEQGARERYLALAKNRQELENLSRRLVDAQEAERRAISRELHDEVGQTLGALLMYIGQLSNHLPTGDQNAQQLLTRIKIAAEAAVKSIRDMALLLRPPMLDDLGLVPALEWQARETSRSSDMEVEVHAEQLHNDPPLTVKVCIYRLVQEALRNAATHAQAKHGRVVLQEDARRIVVEVSDDGKGFEPQRTRGLGILGMEERVRQLAGLFLIRSVPGQGTTVHAELPLNAGASPQP